MEAFESARQELEAKRRQLEQELAEARGKVSEIDSDLERVDEALEALTGGGKRKKKRGGRSSRKKAAPSVAEIQQHLVSVRQQNPSASAHELQESVRSLVRESGASLGNFESLFARALVSSPGHQSGPISDELAAAFEPDSDPFPQ